MALVPKINITQDLVSGTNIRIDDITGNYTADNTGGYGTPNPLISSVTKTRFLFSSVLTRGQASNVTECVPNVEYEITGFGSGTVTVDTKDYVLGDKFILEVDATPTIPSGLYVTETGVYATLTPFLPADGNVYFTPAEMGISQLTFPDSAYQTTYQVFTTSYVATNSLPAGTYIVVGTPLNTILLDSNQSVYNVGEVFTITNSTTFANVVGVNSVSKLLVEITEDFPLFYDAWKLFNAIEQQYATDVCCNKECVQEKLFKMNTLFEALVINYQDDLSVDNTGSQSILDEIINIGNQYCQ